MTAPGLPSVLEISADALVDTIGCRRCLRRRRSTHARVIDLCNVPPKNGRPTCWNEASDELLHALGWSKMRKGWPAWISSTTAPWAVLQQRYAPPSRMPETRFYAPEWACRLLEMGSKLHRLSLTRPLPRNDGEPPEPFEGGRVRWWQVVSKAADDDAFRDALDAVVALAKDAPSGTRQVFNFVRVNAPETITSDDAWGGVLLGANAKALTTEEAPQEAPIVAQARPPWAGSPRHFKNRP